MSQLRAYIPSWGRSYASTSYLDGVSGWGVSPFPLPNELCIDAQEKQVLMNKELVIGNSVAQYPGLFPVTHEYP